MMMTWIRFDQNIEMTAGMIFVINLFAHNSNGEHLANMEGGFLENFVTAGNEKKSISWRFF